MEGNKNSRKEIANITRAFEQLTLEDPEFVNEYLVKYGYDPEEIGSKTAAFVSKLIEEKTDIKTKRSARKVWTHKSIIRLMKEHSSDDPINIIKEKSRVLVLDAFSQGWSGPPFDVISLAKLNGIDVKPSDSIVDARIIPVEEEFQVEYNSSQSPARINFSVAHEIGHTFFSDCAETIRYRETKMESNSWELEFLCNIAAAELLLPYAQFSNEANEIELTLDNLIRLARRYNASPESVFLRFCEVVDKPCAIAIASFDPTGNSLHVDYTKSSSRSNLRLMKGQKIVNKSIVYECIKPGWTRHKIEKWREFGHVNYRIYGVGLSPIKKQLNSRVGIFLVPETYDGTPSKAIYIINGDATEPRGTGTKIIVQVINTSGALGYGFGRAMSSKYPITKKYVQEWKKEKSEFYLGNSQLVPINEELYAFQILAQQGIKAKYGSVPLKYDCLREGLIQLSSIAKELNATIHMPAIGAGQAGGNWNVIKGMIYDELVCKDIETTIYLLPGTNMKPIESRTLTLFKEDE